MKFFALLLLFFLPLFANNYPSFPTQELREIEMTSGTIAKNRSLDYQKIINNLRSKSESEQVLLLNTYLNQLISLSDSETKNIKDYWSTPKEFLIKGRGDCEDYAIIKYYSMIKLGFDRDKLYLTMVKELLHGRNHMVLSYFPNPHHQPLILDNLSFKVLPLNKRTDLKARYFINDNGVFAYNNAYLIPVNAKSKKFIHLIKQVEQEELHTQVLHACN